MLQSAESTNTAQDDQSRGRGKHQHGSFARRWILEDQAGQPSLRAMHRQDAEHPIEQVAKLIHQDQEKRE